MVNYLQSTEQKPLTHRAISSLSSSPSQRKGELPLPADLSPRAPDQGGSQGTSADPKKASSSTGETSQHLASPGLLRGQIPSLGVTSRDTGLCAVPANTHERNETFPGSCQGSAPTRSSGHRCTFIIRRDGPSRRAIQASITMAVSAATQGREGPLVWRSCSSWGGSCVRLCDRGHRPR